MPTMGRVIAAVEKDTKPAKTIDLASLVDEELVAPMLKKALSNTQRAKMCRLLMAEHPDNGFLRTACLRRLAALGQPAGRNGN